MKSSRILQVFYLIFCLGFGSCLSAGDTVLRCYSRLYVNEAEAIQLLDKFWLKHPENRVDERTVAIIEKNTPLKIDKVVFIDTTICDTCRSIFKLTNTFEDYEKNYWWIKSTDGVMVFEVVIGNKYSWTNRFTSDLCVKSVLFTDNVSTNFMNWELTPDQKRKAKKTFEKDILLKLKLLK
ncbi:MAG: hypothetical protein ACK45I_00905 [Bacteroidota bacterium]|jgi:hypothetical protein